MQILVLTGDKFKITLTVLLWEKTSNNVKVHLHFMTMMCFCHFFIYVIIMSKFELFYFKILLNSLNWMNLSGALSIGNYNLLVMK